MMGGHATQTPDIITYYSMVTRETAGIALTIAVLHHLDSILNLYVMALNKEKIWTVLGPEFGDYAGKSVILVRTLYRLKNTGASLRAVYAEIRL